MGSGSVSQTHRAGGFVAEIHANREEVGGAGGFTALATHTVFSAGRRGDLTCLAAIPGHHLEHIERAGTHALGATDAGVVDLDGVGHVASGRDAQGTHGGRQPPPVRHPCSYVWGPFRPAP